MLLCPQFLKGTLEVPEALRLPFHCDFLDLNLSGLLNRKIHGQMDLKFQRSAQKPHIIPFYQVVDRGFYLGDLTPFLLWNSIFGLIEESNTGDHGSMKATNMGIKPAKTGEVSGKHDPSHKPPWGTSQLCRWRWGSGCATETSGFKETKETRCSDKPIWTLNTLQQTSVDAEKQ